MYKNSKDEPSPEARRLLRIPEVAQALALSRRSVWRLIASGDLEVVRIGRSARVSTQALNQFIERKGR